MKILNVSQTYYPYLAEGGRPTKVRALSRALVQRGHRVTVLTADLGYADYSIDAFGDDGAKQDISEWQTTHDGVEVIYLSTQLRYRAITVNSGSMEFALRRLREFDLVHIYGLYDLLGPVIAAFCRHWSIPYVVEPIGMFRPKVRNVRLKRLYHAILGRILLRGASVVVATSEIELQELLVGKVPETRVVVRRNGTDVPDVLPTGGQFRRPWGIAPTSKLVLFLGRVVPIKSLDLLLEAFARCLATDGASLYDTIVVIAGPDEGDGYREKLEALAGRLGISDRVRFIGPIYGDAKWSAYRDADIVVLPSEYESFGNTIAEAVACGTPVLLTDRCGIAPLVKDRAGIVVTHDADALGAGLRCLLTEQEVWQRFRAGTVAVREELGWSGPVAQMEELYLRLVGGRP